MVNLKVLKANNNKLATIPKSIGKCTKLKQLYIQSNELKFLPNEANMKQLDVLKISDDQTEDKCELFETIWEGETVLSCTYFSKFQMFISNTTLVQVFGAQATRVTISLSTKYRKLW